jgi:hypothetical protein
VPKKDNRHALVFFANEVIDDLAIGKDLLPAIDIRKVSGFAIVSTVSSMVMSADRVAALNSDVCESGVTVRVLTEPVQHLNHTACVTLRFPNPHMNVVAVSGGQNLLLMM